MELLADYILHLVNGYEATALWALLIFTALWGCLLGITGVLAVQNYQTDRRDGEGPIE